MAADPGPTLGWLAAAWIAQHCSVPSGHDLGAPFLQSGWQIECTVEFYRVRPGIKYNPTRPLLAPAFVNRRGVIVGPQKVGKSPYGASIVIFEAVGPCIFAGWAAGGESYRCSDHGCGCGWEYTYEPGEPMGAPRRKSLIQLLATAETQTANVYEPIQTMLRASDGLADLMKVTEGFIRLPNGGKIEPVSAAARSKLGNPINFALGDESGIYTATNKLLNVWQTMRRGLAGMGGRSLEITNPWDPMENSAAQQAFESKQADIFRYYRKPPADLSYKAKAERHKIHKYVYADAPWVDVAAIDAEAAELVETDPTQAERFFGNRLVQGLGSYLTETILTEREVEREPQRRICLGFDGSTSGDWTAIRAEDSSGLRFTPTYTVGDDVRETVWNPALTEGRIPRGEVRAAVAHIFANYTVERMYCDPRDWRTEIDEWALLYGEKVVVEWPTTSIGRMFEALDRYKTDLVEGGTSHVKDETFHAHAMNARMVGKPGDKYILGKPSDHQKIDVLMADVLAHEAAADARVTGWPQETANYVYTSANTRRRG